MKLKYIVLISITVLSICTIQLVNANLSTMTTNFEKPNVILELDNNQVLIPGNIGHLNKQYNEDFKTLMQDEINKAEQIRDKLMNTQTRDY